jgi:hypothetical protein
MKKEVAMEYFKVPDKHFLRGTGEKNKKLQSQQCALTENMLQMLLPQPAPLVPLLYDMT